MRRFWNEIQEHRLASGLFLAYWALAYALNLVRWHARKDTLPTLLRRFCCFTP
jgi:hypothetical protein